MSRTGERILRSARAALADIEAGGQGGILHTPEEIAVRTLRRREGMSQADFARTFGLDLRTLQDWEQSRSSPTEAAQTLLKVIRDNPRAVREAVAAAALTDEVAFRAIYRDAQKKSRAAAKKPRPAVKRSRTS